MKKTTIQMRLSGKTNVQKQLYYIYFLAISIPIFLIGVFLILNTRKLLLEHYQSQVESDNVRVRSIIHEITLNIYNISEEVLTDAQLLDIIQEEYDSSQAFQSTIQKYQKVKNYKKNNASISDLSLYVDNPTIGASFDYIKVIDEDVTQTAWYQKAAEQILGFWTASDDFGIFSAEHTELSLIRKIPLPNTATEAILVIRIDRNYLKNRIENTSLSTSVSVNQDPVYFSTDREMQNELLNFDIDYSTRYYQYSGDLYYQNKDCLGRISTLKPYNSDDYIYIVTVDTKAYPAMQSIVLLCFGIIALAALFPLVIIIFFTRRFTNRVTSLRRAMHLASNEEYDSIDEFRGDDELSETFSDLKIMIRKIKEKDAQMYQEQINRQILRNEQQQMEFKMLASQINPHFLYNTLETIRMQAFTAGNRNVATSIKLLGRSMHYVLENTGTASTTLLKELDYISTYLSIQRLRFGDRVNYTLDKENSINLENYHILPLLLQPIVENAILHGLDGVEENGHILIEVYTKQEEFLIITISDNGKGMTPKELERLRKRISQKELSSASSIGLYNINQRIKLCYGSSYHMEIESEQGQGTRVILTLPLNILLEEDA